jgi:hypothetical protein
VPKQTDFSTPNAGKQAPPPIQAPLRPPVRPPYTSRPGSIARDLVVGKSTSLAGYETEAFSSGPSALFSRLDWKRLTRRDAFSGACLLSDSVQWDTSCMA